MSIMHHIDKRQLVFLLVVSTLLFAGTLYRNNQQSKVYSISDRELDAKLLADLRNMDIVLDDSTVCLMQCEGIDTSALTTLISAGNIDYDKCDFRNCHLTTYALEGETQTGKKISFLLETGEESTAIKKLEVNGNSHCSCS
ncbi:MAG: hypothetical protein ACK4IY_00330 [Chitinophagales bacterium]